jgi:hypothetical protein
MGKICDPPLFKGGQSSGIRYWVGAQFFSNTGVPYPGFTYKGMTNLREIRAFGKIYGIRKKFLRSNINSEDTVDWIVDSEQGEVTLLGSVGGNQAFTGRIAYIERVDSLADTGGDPPPTNCRCTLDSCRVDCVGQPNGFCCIDHSITNRLLQVLQN